MSATTVRLSEEPKILVAREAEAAGTTAHSFTLEATAEKAERHTDFHTQAEGRWVEFLETGESIPWEEVRRYLTDRSRGQTLPLPLARTFAE